MPAQLFLRIWFMIITDLAFQNYLSMCCAGLAKLRKAFGKEIHILENDLANLEKIWENYPWYLSWVQLAPGMVHEQGEVKPGLAFTWHIPSWCQERHQDNVWLQVRTASLRHVLMGQVPLSEHLLPPGLSPGVTALCFGTENPPEAQLEEQQESAKVVKQRATGSLW